MIKFVRFFRFGFFVICKIIKINKNVLIILIKIFNNKIKMFVWLLKLLNIWLVFKLDKLLINGIKYNIVIKELSNWKKLYILKFF